MPDYLVPLGRTVGLPDQRRGVEPRRCRTPGGRHAGPRAAPRRLRRGPRARAQRAVRELVRHRGRARAAGGHLPLLLAQPALQRLRRQRGRRAPAVQQAARADRGLRGRALDLPSASTAVATGSSPTAWTWPPRGPLTRTGARPLELLFVGRAEARKGLPVLLRAFEALRSAGRAGAADRCRAPPRRRSQPLLLDPEGVRVAGRVSEEEKWRLLGEADLLCAPSLGGESFGMVLTEAFASCDAGRGVRHRRLSRRRPRRRSTACWCPPPTRPRWARRCATWRSTPPAARRWPRPRASARERFSWPHVADEVIEAYEDAVEMPGARAPRRSARRSRLGLAAADRAPLVRPRRLPSIEPEAPGARRRTRRARGPQGGRDRRRRRRRRPGRAGPRAHRHRVDRLARSWRPRRSGCSRRSR